MGGQNQVERSVARLALALERTAVGHRLRRVDRRPWTRALVNSLALAGALVAVGLVVWLVRNNSGGLGYDTASYTGAAHNLAAGRTMYDPPTVVSTFGTYRYPPIFAQLFLPAILLPDLLVAWLFRLGCLVCLRYLAGSWKGAFICFLLIPVVREMSMGNVTLPIGAGLLLALRRPRAAALVPWLAALKFGPALMLPYLWFCKPESRRPLLAGIGIFAAACAVSFAVAPGLWFEYANTFGWETATQMQTSPVIIALVPSSGGIDFAIRFGLAALVVLFAIRSRRGWLAFAASAITVPYLDFGRLSPLVGLWRFRPEAAAAGEAAEAPPAADAEARNPALDALPLA